MNCPRCQEALEASDREGLHVQSCTGCQGIWLAQGNAEMVSRPGEELPAAVQAELAALDQAEHVEDDSPQLSCPGCAAPMERDFFANSHVVIDRCRCGVWLDPGELEKVMAYRSKSLETLQERHQGDDDFAFTPAALERAFARLYFKPETKE
jgi:Zn-finger nucleic acid-binding protein